MTTENGLPQPLRYKSLSSLERAMLRVTPVAKVARLNLSIERARAKNDPVATERLIALIEGGARPIAEV